MIDKLDDFINQDFVEQVIPLALQIAKRVRNEDHLQPVDILISKFYTECEELAQAEDAWDEIPDIIYYAACLQAQGEGFAQLMSWARLYKLKIMPEEAQVACLAKYKWRAAGNSKDIEVERETIAEALRLYWKREEV